MWVFCVVFVCLVLLIFNYPLGDVFFIFFILHCLCMKIFFFKNSLRFCVRRKRKEKVKNNRYRRGNVVAIYVGIRENVRMCRMIAIREVLSILIKCLTIRVGERRF